MGELSVLRRILLMNVMVLAYWQAAEAATATSGPPTWQSQGARFSVQLTPLYAEQAQAFFENMGYPQGAVREVAAVCVFGTTIRNSAGMPVRYDVGRWRAVTADGKRHRLITKTDWLARWKAFGLQADWSILPPRQTLQPGDWGQGFTTVDLPAGTRFNLKYEWTQDAIEHHASVRGVQCAPRASRP